MTRRDWRAGELTTLLLALVLAVAALTSVGFLADRMHQGLARDARQTLGADLRIRADQPIDPVFFAEAERRGLRTATTAIFPSMAAAMLPDESPANSDPVTRLVAVKAVSPRIHCAAHSAFRHRDRGQPACAHRTLAQLLRQTSPAPDKNPYWHRARCGSIRRFWTH